MFSFDSRFYGSPPVQDDLPGIVSRLKMSGIKKVLTFPVIAGI
jgi:hypothetical protein